MELFVNQVVAGIATGAIYACMALAVVMIYQSIDNLNFAQGEMAMLSTFISWQLMRWGVSYWWAFLLTVIISFVGGIIIERLLFKPLAKAPMMTTVAGFIALFAIINSVAGMIWDFTTKQYPTPFGSASFLDSQLISTHQAGMIGVTVLLLTGLYLFFRFTRIGLAMRAAASEPEAARLVGINTSWMVALGWGMASVIGAIAGMLIAPVVFLEPNMMRVRTSHNLVLARLPEPIPGAGWDGSIVSFQEKDEDSPMTKRRTALVTGSSGLAGGYMLAHLLKQEGWDTVAVSRRKPQIPGNYRHISANLLDAADCRTKFANLTDITHVFYSAYTERQDPAELLSANTGMFVNLIKTIDVASPVLEHVHLTEGTKWYGNHLGPYKTPTKEDDPRHMPPNFYYDQQDFLEEYQKGKSWTWSVSRPHAVCGFSAGGPMNLTLAIAVYANICKALRLPLSFPGKPGAYTALYQCTDAALLAKALEWMATNPTCANQAFNITNGDLIRWQYLWPKFADFFEMELAPPRHISLSRSMADKGPIWDSIVENNGLQKYPYRDIVGWTYPDNVFASDYDIVSDTSKARRFGFHDLVDTEEMFLRMFSEFRRDRIIP